MTQKSKGNFVDFIEEASEGTSPMLMEFLDLLYKEGTTAEDLLKLFHRYSYDGVSLDDCSKLLVVASRGKLPTDLNAKY